MNEPLLSIHPYPADLSFVLKLHRGAEQAGSELHGRIVHVASDRRADFVGNASLLQALQSLVRAKSQPAPSH